MRLARLAFAASLLFAAPALALDAGNRSFAPGRVGAILVGVTKPADLAKIYGVANVKYETMGYEGGQTPGAYIYSDTPNFLQVMFDEDGKSIESVVILGKNWASKSGLRIGIGVAQLERINGGAFKFQGFGVDEGGRVFADGPVLKPFTIHIGMSQRSAGQAVREKFFGDAHYSSRHPAIKSAHLEVNIIYVTAASVRRE